MFSGERSIDLTAKTETDLLFRGLFVELEESGIFELSKSSVGGLSLSGSAKATNLF